MANSFPQTESPRILTGWKDIANHLGKGVRTVQRYERELGLPVRRPTSASAVVVAITAEVDAWVEACPMRSALRSEQSIPSSGEPAVRALRKNVEEMRRLRERLQELRGELRYSLEMLRTNIRFVERDAHAELSQSSASGLTTSMEAIGIRTNSIPSNHSFAQRNENLLRGDEGQVR